MKNQEEWQLELIENPKYTSDWINEASKILANEKNKFNEENLSYFDALELNVMNDILDSDYNDIESVLNTLFIENNGLNATQMKLYWTGIYKGLLAGKMKKFLDPSIPYAKSNYAIQALLDGYDEILDYIDDYNPSQIAEIYSGMKDGINYKLYAKPELSSDVMNLVRHALCVEDAHTTINLNNGGIIVVK